MQKTQIAPSLLSADFGNLHTEIAALEAAKADLLHLDVMDGHFVPNLSFGFPLIKTIRSLSKLPLDVHLMVSNPDFHVPLLAEIGVQWISFHQETVFHSHRLIQQIKSHGIKAGLVRPKVLWPYPTHVFERLAKTANQFLVVEMSCGQMVEDVKLSVNGKKPVYFFGRTGGTIPSDFEILNEVDKIVRPD